MSLKPNIEAARAFAHKWHDYIGQVRKYTKEPYWVHTNEVADIVTRVPWSPLDSVVIHWNMICASHGHDLLEDVLTWLEKHKPEMVQVFHTEYVNTFTPETRQMIVDLTDVYVSDAYPHMKRAERKERERERIGTLSPFSKTIKLADLISNTKSIVEHDKDFAQVYIREKITLLPKLADGSPELFRIASMQVVSASEILGIGK